MCLLTDTPFSDTRQDYTSIGKCRKHPNQFVEAPDKYATFDFGDGQNPENQYCQEPESYSVESNKIFLSRTKPDYFA